MTCRKTTSLRRFVRIDPARARAPRPGSHEPAPPRLTPNQHFSRGGRTAAVSFSAGLRHGRTRRAGAGVSLVADPPRRTGPLADLGREPEAVTSRPESFDDRPLL